MNCSVIQNRSIAVDPEKQTNKQTNKQTQTEKQKTETVKHFCAFSVLAMNQRW